MTDAATAAMLLRPFRAENLTGSSGPGVARGSMAPAHVVNFGHPALTHYIEFLYKLLMETLRGELDEELAGGIAARVERLVMLFRRLTPPQGLSLTATSALAALERSGPCRLTALAAQAGVTQPAMTQLISRLEEAGLARREPDLADGRVVMVRITEHGRALVAGRRAARAQRLAVMLAKLSPEDRAALAAALPAMEALASADPGDETLTETRPLS